MQDTPLPERATYLSKLEIFNHRGALDLPSSVTQDDLKNISFYSFWRLYSVQGKRLRKRQREKMLALNGCGWPRQAKTSHALHQEYARKTLYAYAPCADLAGTEYLDQAISKYFHNDWGRALKHFVEDFGNHWCPTWIKRNYCMENPPDSSADTAVALQERLKKKYMFQFEEEEDQDALTNVKQEMSGGDTGPAEPTTLSKPTGPTTIPSDNDEEAATKSRWQATITSGEPQVNEDHLAPQSYDTDHHWDPEGRPPWQRHSELGPNLEAQGKKQCRKQCKTV